MARILILEDDPISQKIISHLITTTYDHATVGNIGEARQLIETEKFDLLICDYRLSDGTAIDLLRWMNEKKMKIPVILISKFTGSKELAMAWKHGAFDFIQKPILKERLLECLKLALEFGQVDWNFVQFNRETLFHRLKKDEKVFCPEKLTLENGVEVEFAKEVFRDCVREISLAHENLTQISFENPINSETLFKAVHKLHGAAASVYAERLSHLCLELSESIEREEEIQPSDVYMILNAIKELHLQIEIHLHQDLVVPIYQFSSR